MSIPVLRMTNVSKAYGALRPLRLEHLEVRAGQHVAVVGLDQPAAEVFISLVTGAGLPDAGAVEVFGSATSATVDSEAWLASLDRFGVVSDRAPLLDGLSVMQNLVLPFSLDLDGPGAEVEARVSRLADEVGLPASALGQPVESLGSLDRLRLRLARALALDPQLLVIEHPSATIARDDVTAMAKGVRSVVERRGVATITITMDRVVADALAADVRTIDPVTGKAQRGWWSRLGLAR